MKIYQILSYKVIIRTKIDENLYKFCLSLLFRNMLDMLSAILDQHNTIGYDTEKIRHNLFVFNFFIYSSF